MASEASFASGALLAGKYRVLDLLGQGGMGAVYLAENVDIGRQVAIKVLKPELAADPNSLARFRQEARAAASIGHPGIVEILDMGMLPEGGAFIVMERLEGMTLREKLAREGSLFPQDAAALVGAVLETLAAAHDKGVIHRDLKPDNIFLADRPVPGTKILDFGISKFRGTGDVALTRTGMVMGTPLYMSPEQARGARDVGVTADLYSIGAILYEALSGQPPFPGESYNEVLAKVLMDTARPLGQLRPDVPAAMADLIASLLAKDPAARPQTARDTAQQLRASVPAGYAPQGVPPRGTSSTFIRPTPPAPLVSSHQTGPRPPAPEAAIPATLVRPPHAGAHASTQPQQVMDAVAIAPGGKRGRLGLWLGGGLAVLVAVAFGIRLGQRSAMKSAARVLQAEHHALKDGEEHAGGVHIEATDKGLVVETPQAKVVLDDNGVQATAKVDEAADAGAAVAAQAAPAPTAGPKPNEPARPAKRGGKWGPRPAGYRPGHKGSKVVLPGFTPGKSYP